jgi:hypothetical protein
MTTTSTDYSKQIEILNNLFLNNRDEERFADFVDFNDVGLPLAYAIFQGIVQSTPMAEDIIKETFQLLLALFNINNDTGFTSLSQILITT